MVFPGLLCHIILPRAGLQVAMALKRRCFELLGMEPYNEHWADGLQILRYNTTTAYINHLGESYTL